MIKSEYVDLWVRDAERWLQRQVKEEVSDRSDPEFNFLLHTFRSVNRDDDSCDSHPFSSKVAREAIPEVVKTIKQSEVPGVEWNDGADLESRLKRISNVLLLQVYSDVSTTSLSASALAFYPFQASFLNFTHKFRDKLIVNGNAMLAYFPTDSTWR